LVQPFIEIYSFFRRNVSPETEEQAMKTLSYFDIMNLADRLKVPVLMSIGMIDTVTPPSTVFAAYNHLVTEIELKVYR
ncbi:acetylxylan esterase, partial [Bacillus vallismortis]|nr:acetylxylan esterase [Bacillus vallismortis]